MVYSQQRRTKVSISLLSAFVTVATLIFSVVSACDDVPPNSKYSCHQQAVQWSKCDEPWMKDKCNKSCGRCKRGPVSANSPSVESLKINAPGDMVNRAPLNSNGVSYRRNKGRVVEALKSAGLSDAKLKLCLAIAMLETNTFDPKDRDTTKTGGATNYSGWNMNGDFLSRIGVNNPEGLNSWSGVGRAAKACKMGLSKFGVNGFLNFHRGGITGWKDPTKFQCDEYRNGIATMIRILDADPSLMTDDRRIDLSISYVG